MYIGSACIIASHDFTLDCVWVYAVLSGECWECVGVLNPVHLSLPLVPLGWPHWRALSPPRQGLSHVQGHAHWWVNSFSTAWRCTCYLPHYRLKDEGYCVSGEQWANSIQVFLWWEELSLWRALRAAGCGANDWNNSTKHKVCVCMYTYVCTYMYVYGPQCTILNRHVIVS